MSDQNATGDGKHTWGVVVGLTIFVFAFPAAVLLGGLSVPWHRGVGAGTFWRGVTWPCRAAFYIVAAAVGIWVLVLALYIRTQLMVGLLLTLGGIGVAYYVLKHADPPGQRGGAL